MPGGMNGFELISKARAIRSGLKALVTSGYANVHRPGTDRPDVPLLLKPYRRGDLAHSSGCSRPTAPLASACGIVN